MKTVIIAFVFLAELAVAQTPPQFTISTIAGNGVTGFSGDGGPAIDAEFSSPRSVTADGNGNLYVTDVLNNRIRKIAPNGTITTIAGTGAAAFSGDNGPATAAALNQPSRVAIDSGGNLFIADQFNNLMCILTNRILNADCLKAMPMLPEGSVDFVLTDPPYITRYRSRDGRTVRNDDNDHWLKPAFAEIHRVLKENSFCVTFYGWPMADRFIAAYKAAGFRLVGHLMFPKRYASSTRFLQYRHESAHLLAKGEPKTPDSPIPDVIPWDYTGNRLHPTQKPVSALVPLIEAFSAPGQTVLDPFAGSGSSLVAAQSLGRKYIGVELDSKYHAAARKRLKDGE